MIAIIDYDAGNIRSVEKALLALGQDVIVTADRDEILHADKVILPGGGAFGDAMEKLKQSGLDEVIREVTEKGTPFLGICLGLQLLFEHSDEAPGVEGLGILKGEILRIPDKEGYKIPHMGWNSLHLENDGRLFKGIAENSYVYFVLSCILFILLIGLGYGQIGSFLFIPYITLYISFCLPQCNARFASLCNLSYDIYLCGWPIQQMVISEFGGSMAVGLNILISIPLSIMVGYVSYMLIEKYI